MRNKDVIEKWRSVIDNDIDNSKKEDDLRVITENTKRRQLYNTVIQFMKDQDITCEETIHQCDRVIENAYDFITDLFNIVKEDLNFDDVLKEEMSAHDEILKCLKDDE